MIFITSLTDAALCDTHVICTLTTMKDAIQNIVFDVNADIEITEHEQLVSADARRLEGACVITFTTTISYHSYSAFLDAATVADRPFIDKEMRSNYIDYLMNNNGLTYIGNIASVSE